MPTTADTPKCYAEVSGRRLIDWAIDAFHQNGIDDIAFIGGYINLGFLKAITGIFISSYMYYPCDEFPWCSMCFLVSISCSPYIKPSAN